MSTADLLQVYGATLDANSALDAAYYKNPNPKPADRADYHRRIERTERLRERVYAVLSADNASMLAKTNDVKDGLRHLLLNRLNVILGYADLLTEASVDSHTRESLARICLSALEMAEIIRSSLP